MDVPAVYPAILKVARDLAKRGVPKRHYNEEDGYQYRSIDDLLNTLAPILVRARLVIRPRALERCECQKTGPEGELLTFVSVKVGFELSSASDGSFVTVETFGEAADEGDKATAKALTAAYKAAVLQTFCIPIGEAEDARRSSKKREVNTHEAEPVQGWEQWTADLSELARGCETGDAVLRLRKRYRTTMRSLSKERPDLYASLGKTFEQRRFELCDARNLSSNRSATRTRRQPAPDEAALEHA